MSDQIGWYRTKLDKAVLQELNQRSDLQGFLKCGAMLVLVCLTGAGCWQVFYHVPIWILPAFFLHGTVVTFLTPAAAGHELSHGTVFKSKLWNSFFTRLFGFITWTNTTLFRISHMRHHHYTVHHGLDLEVVLPMKIGVRKFITGATFDPVGIYQKLRNHLCLSFKKPEGEWQIRLLSEADAETRKKVFNESRIVLSGHLLLIGLCLVSGYWILIPIALIPFYCGWLATLCAFPQHAGLPPNVNDFRTCCRTMRLDPISRYLYWNMNYHTEHHMYAAIPFYKLPELHEQIRHDCPPPCKSMWAAWKEILVTQTRQKTEPDYTFDNYARGKGSSGLHSA